VPSSQTLRLSLLASHLTSLLTLTQRDVMPSHIASSLTDLDNKTASDLTSARFFTPASSPLFSLFLHHQWLIQLDLQRIQFVMVLMFTIHPVFQITHPAVVFTFIIRPDFQTLALVLTRRQSKCLSPISPTVQ